ncbi:DUF4054 domain-containing protein [Campylobacter sp. faydin G-24]|uniref:DUF4054 domain-containing protein n=1 Tax=Campylobacter anatolicus TaxID=2829105 RepID=A0ABS5HJV3_9BACT|nr:DUF4054 domain-containing protein [Campylobacter anatolicus]MBR8464285.1 DUF4054 domain-containing protein [Campylobacter anatolicus]
MNSTALKIRYPEFKEIDNDLINAVIDEAKNEINRRNWGRFYESGVLALAGHLLFLQGALKQGGAMEGTAVKEVASKTVGSLSISYSSAKTGFESESGSYYLSIYGQRFLELKSKINNHFRLVK